MELSRAPRDESLEPDEGGGGGGADGGALGAGGGGGGGADEEPEEGELGEMLKNNCIFKERNAERKR